MHPLVSFFFFLTIISSTNINRIIAKNNIASRSTQSHANMKSQETDSTSEDEDEENTSGEINAGDQDTNL